MRCPGPAILALLLAACGGGGGGSPSTPATTPVISPSPVPVVQPGVGPASCTDGRAGDFACNGIHLSKRVTLAELGGNRGNDLWGWTDPQDGSEYALVGLDDGVTFVNVTDPENPVVVGRLATATVSSPWRDIKVARDYAYIVADGVGNHGMQVFDLTRLRDAGTNQSFLADVTYGDFGSAHNIAINEESQVAYVVGSDTCAGGLHMIDISVANNPLFAGCHDADGDTHDAQCVTYHGPDTEHTGQEVCFNANESHVVIVDVSDKPSPITIADFTYPNLGFVHQVALSEDHRFMFLGDELDELGFGMNTRTLVFDVSDLDTPALLYEHRAPTASIDHNMYVAGNRLYQANYTAGLRILEFTDLSTDTLSEVAFFDTWPAGDAATFNGAWSVYPFFASGVVIVSDIERGLFVLSL
ncbi:MAG: choice-of-anchor B family protein [Gammaproteobacteria bacterium]|nr:choice-of-anchor B family protein [Gammaproteobacteria bacterium]